VGDSAIWLGELAFLEQQGCRIRHVCSKDDYDRDEVRTAARDGVILLSGGGNFGDAWPGHQAFRERVLTDFPDHRIIQLPQSISFSGVDAIRRVRAALAAHRDFHLVTRDRESLHFAQSELGVSASLCPDMVHMLELPGFSGAREHRLVILSRDDHEKLPVSKDALEAEDRADILVTDWLRQPRFREAKRYRQARRWARHSWIPAAARNRMAMHYARAIATERLRFGYRLLGSARAIVTDRLHACLLGRLGGSPVCFVDNSYGKLSSYVETWLRNDPGLIACTGFADARRRAEALFL
jgi:pyruvyl transferase EpsO